MVEHIQRQLAAQGVAPPSARKGTTTPRTRPPRPDSPAAAVASVTGKKRRQDEAALQTACVRWFRLEYPEYGPLLFAIPNGGRRGKAEAGRLKAEGVTAGVPDCLLALATSRAPGLFLELKAGKNKPSPAQVAMLAHLAAQGYATAVVYSFDAFRAAVQRHIGY